MQVTCQTDTLLKSQGKREVNFLPCTTLSFEIAPDWKLSFIKLIFLFRLTRLLSLISLSHLPTELLFYLLKSKIYLPWAIGPGFFLSWVDVLSRFGKRMHNELMFLPHFDIFCDLLLSRCMATCNLQYLLYNT